MTTPGSLAVSMLLAACSLDATAGLDMQGAGDDGGSDGGQVCVPPASTDPDTVVTKVGTFHGSHQKAVHVFRGIRFAQPPLDGLRFQSAVPAQCDDRGVIEATRFGASCLQPNVQTGDIVGDEDCLTLNIWTPSLDPNARLPVAIMFHGGSNVIGSGSNALYDGYSWAADGGVWVTFNYRLGALGMLALPAFQEQNPDHADGSYLISDGVAAAEWVRRNIDRFGGDPSKIGFLGWSSGAAGASNVAASPKNSAAPTMISLSGGLCGTVELATAHERGVTAANAVGCDADDAVIDCLRTADAREIIRQTTNIYVNRAATRDGIYGSDSCGLLPALSAKGMPVIISNTAEEYATLSSSRAPTSKVAFESAAKGVFAGLQRPVTPDQLGRVSAAYGVTAQSGATTVPRAWFRYLTDVHFTCEINRAGERIAMAGGRSFRNYQVLGLLSADSVAAGASGDFAVHGDDVQLLVGAPGLAGSPLGAASRAMRRYWSSLIASGAPVSSGQPAWPAWTAQAQSTLSLGDNGIDVLPGAPQAPQCAVLNPLFGRP